jgi:hypothetical protein
MPVLDHNAPFLLWAFGITAVVLGGYGLYLWSRLKAVKARLGDYSARNVSAAAPIATAAQPASRAKGPSAL